MPLPDTTYCAQQIDIPPELPDLLKQFTKAAIRTQPRDVLLWCAAYFHALAKGETLPVKDRLEMHVATQKTDTGLTPGLLKVLHKQLSPSHIDMSMPRQTCSREDLRLRWQGVCLPEEQLHSLLCLGNFTEEEEHVDWMHFFALGCSALGGSIQSALRVACEILTEDEEGGAARIPFSTFVTLYTFLARLDGDVPPDRVQDVLGSLHAAAEQQAGMIKPLDFIHLENLDRASTATTDRTE